MARRRTPIVSTWRRPKTSIYNDNYSFGFNFYDDMMKWLNKRETGIKEPVPMLPSVPETQFRKFARPKTPDVKKFEDEMLQSAVKRTHDRIENLVWRKEREPRRRARSAEREFGSQESLDTITYGGGSSLGLRERRSRLEQQQQEIDSRMAAAGLRFSSEVQTTETTTSSASNYGSMRRAERLAQVREAHASMDNTTGSAQAELGSKQLESRIIQLESRLEESENRVRTEVMRVKRAYEDQIAELEIRLEQAHRQNLDLQKTIQRQAMHFDK